jgi:hypothetical protein
MFNGALRYRNRYDLLADDIHPRTDELWGNFHQTYSMAGLILTTMAGDDLKHRHLFDVGIGRKDDPKPSETELNSFHSAAAGPLTTTAARTKAIKRIFGLLSRIWSRRPLGCTGSGLVRGPPWAPALPLQ